MKVNVEDTNSLLTMYKALKDNFINNEVIVTLKSSGVLYAVNDNVQYMPTIQVQEVDRTGAGDVFDGAFTYAISKGYDLEKCMRIANIAAGLSTTKVGAKTSIPILSDVINYYESKFGPIDAVDQNLTPAAQDGNNVVASMNQESESVASSDLNQSTPGVVSEVANNASVQAQSQPQNPPAPVQGETQAPIQQ